MSLHRYFSWQWQRHGVVMFALLPLSGLFGLMARLRPMLYRCGVFRVEKLPRPVLVVGNIFVGGTGKTPAVIWLVEALRAWGFNPGVISRGHGGSGDIRFVTPQTDPAQCGDEPVLIAYRTGCPVCVGRNRAAAGRALLAARPEIDVVVTDDGLQHYALARDIEIVLFDTRGAGNGWLLPAGPLREPLSRPRDFTLINGGGTRQTEPDTFPMRLVTGHAYALANPQMKRALTAFADTGCAPLLAAAGIGHPERFFATLEAAGLVCERLPLPDHFDFATPVFESRPARCILITEKDAVKCALIPALRDDPRIWVVPVTAEIDARLATQIVEKIRGYPSSGHSGLPAVQGPAAIRQKSPGTDL